MKTALTIAAALLTALPTIAQQSIQTVLTEIEAHSPTLAALRADTEAQRAEHHVGLALDAPTAGYNTLWGSPSDIGHRTDVTVSQPFDIATLSGAKRRVAREQDAETDHRYREARQAVLLEAKQTTIDIIYYNARLAELRRRHAHAAALCAVQQRRVDAGEVSILEYNNARLSLSRIETATRKAETERQAALAMLAEMNGGEPLTIADTAFAAVTLPADFNAWAADVAQRHPAVAAATAATRTATRQTALARQEALPQFSLGYMSEKTVGEHFQGLAVGVAVPLWGSAKRIRQAKAAVTAAQLREADEAARLRATLLSAYQRAKGLAAAASRQTLLETDNSRLLAKALDAGEISLVEYLVGLSYYYDAFDDALEAERDSQKAAAELMAVDL